MEVCPGLCRVPPSGTSVDDDDQEKQCDVPPPEES
jgi:hypothetical protein